MASDTTKLTIELSVLLKNLNSTLQGLNRVQQKLQQISQIRVNVNTQTAGTQRAELAAQRLAFQQERLNVQAQELANRQERARQATERLALSQQRLETASARAANAQSTLSRQLGQVGNSLRSIGQGVSSVGITLSAAVTAPLVALGAAVTDAAVQMDSLKRGLTAIVGSSAEASVQLKRLQEIAKLPGIGFEEAIQGSIRLQAVGFSAKDAERALVQFSNAVALTGGGREELERITVQLGQLAAKGRVLSQDLRPIIEAAPAVGRALLQAFGTVNADDIQALNLSTKEFFDTLVAQLAQLPRASAGAKNAFENFRDEVFRAAAAVGEALLPTLVNLAQVAGPVITKLADIFKSLPEPVQLIVLGFGALATAAGPVLFIFGQLLTGIGRITVGLVQLNAAGIVPTIRNLLAMGAAAEEAGAATAAITGLGAAGTAGLIGLGTALVGLIAVIVAYSNATANAVKISDDQLKATEDQIDSLQTQVKFLDGLTSGVKRTTNEENRLRTAYEQLNIEARARVTAASDEAATLARLREEIGKLLALRVEERNQQAASIAASLANSVAQAQASEQSISSTTEQIRANGQLIESIEKTGKITDDQTKQLARLGIQSGDVAFQLQQLRQTNQELVKSQGDSREQIDKLVEGSRNYLTQLDGLQQRTGLTTRQTLELAKVYGLLNTGVDEALQHIQAFREEEERLRVAAEAVTGALFQQTQGLLKAGDAAEQEAQRRKTLIQKSASLAREAAKDFEGALKFLEAFRKANPQLAADLQRQAEIEGKSLLEVMQDAIGGKNRGEFGEKLRNAQEQLNQAMAALAREQAERQLDEQKRGNEAELRLHENQFKLNLISLNTYLSARNRLIKANLQLEINAQKQIVDDAIAEQQRFLARAKATNIKAPERVQSEAKARAAEERAVQAQSKILELQDKQKQTDDELAQALAEHAQQQERDLRQLQIEYGKLTGRIEDALNAATDERFRETLQQLALDQETLNKRIIAATKARDADGLVALKLAQQQNQAQIDEIQNVITQERALNSLAAAQELVTRAKEKQADLEKDLTFQVEFRGLREEDAIQQRLAGEAKLADSLRLSRDTIQQIIDALNARGVKPPQALIDFITQLNQSLQGLTELSFSEQFRFVEKEFNRLNDERLQRIADVERAVRNRDIAEAEGLLFIRRINGQYVGDLQQQLDLLKQIANASNDANLQKQAQLAEETVKDANDKLADFNKQLRSTSIDALQESFADFFKSIGDRSQTAKEKLLNFVNSFVSRVNAVIAENLSRKLIESIFGGDNTQPGQQGQGQVSGGGGFLAGLFGIGKSLFGFGGNSSQKQNTDALNRNTEALEHVSGTLGGQGAAGGGLANTVAGVLGVGGGTSASAGAGPNTAAGGLKSLIGGVAAGISSAFGVTVPGVTATAPAGSTLIDALNINSDELAQLRPAIEQLIQALQQQAQSGSGGGFAALFGGGSGIGDFASGDILPARPGGRVVRVAEGGHAEAVLTTDPAHAVRQARLLTQFLKMTRGLGGRFAIPALAEGALIASREAQFNLLNNVQRSPTSFPSTDIGHVSIASANGPAVSFRNINLINRTDMVRGHLRSPEGARDIINIISENGPEIGRRLGVR